MAKESQFKKLNWIFDLFISQATVLGSTMVIANEREWERQTES